MRGHGLAAPASARAIEAGARIIAAPRGGTTVVLQMPRGNLEAVSHRLLVNALVDTALQVCLAKPAASVQQMLRTMMPMLPSAHSASILAR